MTAKKSLKRRVRARMEKTGERYTAARRHVISPSEDENTSPQAEAATALPDANSVAAMAETPVTESLVVETSSGAPTPATVHHPGTSDAAVRRATGRGWDEWLSLIDAWGGASKTHPEIAAYLSEVHGVDGWWAQSVTVGYERARGLRAPGN